MSVALLLLVVGISLCLKGMMLLALFRKLFPGKMYDFFLCHHKHGAAVLCRWLKQDMLIQTNGKVKVFLDSDELEGLADIADIVKNQTGTLVLVATKMLLTRPWCAVEIATAVRSRVNMLMVRCPDFRFYKEEEPALRLDQLGHHDPRSERLGPRHRRGVLPKPEHN